MANLANEVSSIDFGSIIGGSLNAVVNAQSESAKTTVNFIRSVGFEQTGDGSEGATGKPIYVSFKYPKEVAPYTPATPRTYSLRIERAGSGYPDVPLIFKAGEQLLNCSYERGAEGELTNLRLQEMPNQIEATTEVTIAAQEGAQLPEGAAMPTGDAAARITLVVTEAQEARPAVYQDMQVEVPILTMVPIPFIKIAEANIEFNVKISSVSNTESSETTDKSGSLEASASGGCRFFRASAKLNASFSNQKATSSSEEVKRDYSLNIKVRAVQDDMPAGVEKMMNILEEAIVNKIA